jgi:hypothetical protein
MLYYGSEEYRCHSINMFISQPMYYDYVCMFTFFIASKWSVCLFQPTLKHVFIKSNKMNAFLLTLGRIILAFSALHESRNLFKFF